MGAKKPINNLRKRLVLKGRHVTAADQILRYLLGEAPDAQMLANGDPGFTAADHPHAHSMVEVKNAVALDFLADRFKFLPILGGHEAAVLPGYRLGDFLPLRVDSGDFAALRGI